MNDEIQSTEVKRAFHTARAMKWAFPLFPLFVLLLAGIVALVTGNRCIVLIGFILALFGSIAVYFVGIKFCRCPKCGQYWWSPISMGIGWLSMITQAEIGPDETKTYTCRNCGLEIGPHLRK